MLVYLGVMLLFCFLYWWYRDSKQITAVSDKHVYITGCDSGFGHLLAQHLDKQGFHVLAACFTKQGAQELEDKTSSRLKTFQLDVTNSESIGKAAEFVKSQVKDKGLWGLVNNAGISQPTGPSDWLTIDDYKVQLDVNLIGLIEVTLSMIPLIKRARGRIVNMASICGRLSCFGGSYCISKFGVEAFNDSLRRDLQCFGVKVACIEPGYFKTSITNPDLIKEKLIKLWGRLPRDVQEDYGDDYLDKTCPLMKKNIEKLAEPNLMKVVSRIHHALTSVHPRSRYAVGVDAKLFWIPLSYMPTAFTDFLLVGSTVKPAKAVY
ncbi:retinol dehydrogenase 16-like [Leucoraja erinacea]|uniref:retinol dehydrogenase 16-like n=1 Tax=Leucoraja erinaceus TaxID=7782 RepID=UPI002456C35E|nr:retinol dehydrogenase 16-like [Leucoraja erinacea]XP_055493672.1 retinol dehydrogenase 16-like [Leucoraja erinacea]XP_055493674.1 retinol dehydrogenase 16-like [Leucoraja erinacea]XP_055493675.1 retinol dehydrogenase 16-like [Leucoraja erinacea]